MGFFFFLLFIFMVIVVVFFNLNYSLRPKLRQLSGMWSFHAEIIKSIDVSFVLKDIFQSFLCVPYFSLNISIYAVFQVVLDTFFKIWGILVEKQYVLFCLLIAALIFKSILCRFMTIVVRFYYLQIC